MTDLGPLRSSTSSKFLQQKVLHILNCLKKNIFFQISILLTRKKRLAKSPCSRLHTIYNLLIYIRYQFIKYLTFQ